VALVWLVQLFDEYWSGLTYMANESWMEESEEAAEASRHDLATLSGSAPVQPAGDDEEFSTTFNPRKGKIDNDYFAQPTR
jgi:hypothetical protein